MRTKLFVLALLVGALGFAATTHATATRQWALIKYDSPVRVGNATLLGTCVIEHDDAKMAQGLPCTSIYNISPEGHRTLLVSFHCVPAQRTPVREFTTVVRHTPELGTTLLRMVAYQFAGDSEAHGVPVNLTH